MKTLLRSIPVGLAILASSFGSAAHAAVSDDQVAINAEIQEYVVLRLEAPSVNLEAEIADLNAGYVDSDSFNVEVQTNVPGNVTVRVKTLDLGDSRATKITPSDLQLKVTNGGDGQIAAFANFASPPTNVAQNIWTQFDANGPRTKSFDVIFRHNNVNLYAGKSTPYTNRIEFSAVTN